MEALQCIEDVETMVITSMATVVHPGAGHSHTGVSLVDADVDVDTTRVGVDTTGAADIEYGCVGDLNAKRLS